MVSQKRKPSVTGFEASPTILTELMAGHAKWHPDKTALVYGEQRLTWREFNRRINRVANGLIARGLQKGDKVALYAPNVLEISEIIFGAVKAGGVIVPLSTLLAGEPVRILLDDSDAQFLFAGTSTHTVVGQFKRQLKKIPEPNFFLVGSEAEGWASYQSLVDRSSDGEPHVELNPEDDFNIIYTSGTTGVPKGIVHTHYVRAQGALTAAIELRMASDAISLATTLLFSNGSLVMTLFPTMIAGGTVVIMPRFDPESFIRLARQEKCTHTFMVPAQYIALLERREFNERELSSLRLMASSGAPLRVETRREILSRFTGVLAEVYGLAEGIGTILSPEDVVCKVGSVGVPIMGSDVLIIDDQDNELPRGEIGEIVGYGSGLMSGYYKQPEKTAEVLWKDERGRRYLKSGDIGRLDEEGYLYILDRKKDMIISGGVNVFAGDIEEVFARHPETLDVAVIGVPDERWGETPLALVIRRKVTSASTAEELKNWANQQLGKHQRVSRVEFREQFPINALGKVLKKELRKLYLREDAHHKGNSSISGNERDGQ